MPSPEPPFHDMPERDPVLYHISDIPGVTIFEPRPHAVHPGKMVWAVDREHLRNFMLPRECPRVTYYPLPESKPGDVDRLMYGSTARAIIAIESRWMPEVVSCRLYQYAFPPEPFQICDAGAGFYISRQAVTPLGMTVIEDVLGALLSYDVELRVMPSLWKLREMVIASTLQFSIIRMRNAQPPAEGYEAYHPL